MSQSLELHSPADSQVSLLLSKFAWLTAMGQIACCTNKCQVGSEIIVVHAMMKEIVFQIFCSSACIKVISETLCWSYQCLRTLQFVCHVGEVTETGIFVHHKSHANREGKLLQLKLTKNLISGRSC